MYYAVSQDIFAKLPTACFGAVAVRGLDNTRPQPELEAMLQENIAACEAYFEGVKPKESPAIVPYREAFRALDINPNKFLCSIEALLTRIAKGKGLEVNTSGVNSVGMFLPDAPYLRRYRELGGEIVTVGSDSHTAARVGQHVDAALAMIGEIFGYVCTFADRKPIYHKL